MASQKSIQELLEKYWAAETTPEEEAVLRDALKNNSNDSTGMYFNFLAGEQNATMPSELKPARQGRVVSLKRTLSIAASVLILVVAGVLIQRTMVNGLGENGVANAETLEDSFEEPEKAYEETRAALLLVSAKMNQSRKQAGEQIAKTQPYIEILK